MHRLRCQQWILGRALDSGMSKRDPIKARQPLPDSQTPWHGKSLALPTQCPPNRGRAHCDDTGAGLHGSSRRLPRIFARALREPAPDPAAGPVLLGSCDFSHNLSVDLSHNVVT